VKVKAWCIALAICNVSLFAHFLPISLQLYAQTYYLKDLINHGLKNSLDILRSQNSLQDASDKKTVSYLGLLPSADYSMSYSNHSSGYENYYSNLSIGKSIYLNEPTYWDIRSSSLSKKIATLTDENYQKKIAFDILVDFIDITKQNKNIQIMEENAKLQSRIHEQVKIQYLSKRKSDYEYRQSELDTLNAYIQLVELRDQLAQLRQNLFFKINLKDEGYPIEDYDFAFSDDPTFDQPINSLSLQISDLNLKQNKSNLTQQYISLYPSLSASYSWNAYHNDRTFNSQFADADYYETTTNFSVNLSYPLFDFLASGINYRISKRQYSLAEYEYQKEQEDLQKQVSQTTEELRRMKSTYNLYQQKHELAKMNLEIAEMRFAQGSVNNLDLDKARIQFLESEYQLINQFYTLVIKYEELNYITSHKILGTW